MRIKGLNSDGITAAEIEFNLFLNAIVRLDTNTTGQTNSTDLESTDANSTDSNSTASDANLGSLNVSEDVQTTNETADEINTSGFEGTFDGITEEQKSMEPPKYGIEVQDGGILSMKFTEKMKWPSALRSSAR